MCMKKFFISFVSLLFLSIASWGDDEATVDGIKYILNASTSPKTATVTYPNDSEPGESEYKLSSVVIPATITVDEVTYNVTAIGDKAFRKSGSLTSITLPEGLLSIGNEALYKTNITELVIPNSVTTLGNDAVEGCGNLTTITLGEHCADNNWGQWVFWRSSGAYDVYMVCDVKPTLYDDITFDQGHTSTIHIYPELIDTYKADPKWACYNIVGDLQKDYTYADLQTIISSSNSILTNEVGTDPGYYLSSSAQSLRNAVEAAEALTESATPSQITNAVNAIITAKEDLTVNPLTEGYYYIENAEKKQMLYAEAAYAADGGLGIESFNDTKAKFYFRLTKKGSNWYMKCVKNNMYAGKPVNGNEVNQYITLTEDPEFEQVITYVSPGKFKIQSLYDGTNASYPYSVSGGWVLLSSSESERTCWRFHPATIGKDVNGILTEAEVEGEINNALSNGDSYVDLSSNYFVSEYLTSNMPANSNLLAKVKSDSGIKGTNIVNDDVCQSLVLTDGQPFGYYKDITATAASYERTVTNKFGTICLPFAVSSDENVQYYTLNKVENSTLYLTTAATVEAGVPAVFEMKNGTMLTAIASDATVKGSVVNGDGTLKLIGTFAGETITTNLSNSYYISSDKFRQATNSITVNPFRAYFTTTSNEVKAFDLSTEDNETAINNVQSSISNVQSVFDANGMKLQSLRKGLNIVKKNDGNVQKIMVK